MLKGYHKILLDEEELVWIHHVNLKGLGGAQSFSEHESMTCLFCFIVWDQRMIKMMLNTHPLLCEFLTLTGMGSRLSNILL